MPPKKQKDGYGSVIRKKGRNKLYIKLPLKMRERLSEGQPKLLPENIATGKADTKQGERQAYEMLAELNRQYDCMRKLMPVDPVRYFAAVQQKSLTIKEAFDAFKDDYLANKEFKTKERFTLSFRAVVPEDEFNTPIDKTYREGKRDDILWIEKLISSYITHGSKDPKAKRVVTKSGDTGKILELRSHSGRTIADYVTNMHTFLKWCQDYGHVSSTPRWSILRRKIPNWVGKPIKIYSRWECDQFLRYNKEIAEGVREPYRLKPISSMDSAQKRYESIQPKLRWLRLNFYYQLRMFDLIPFRVHETYEVQKKHIDFKSNLLTILRKDHKKYDYFPITDKIRDLFEEMFEVLSVTDKLLPFTETNTPMLRSYLYNSMDGTGIERDGRSFHEFKKKFITELILGVGGQQMNLFEIAKLARCDIEIIQNHYLQIPSNTLRQLLNGSFERATSTEGVNYVHQASTIL